MTNPTTADTNSAEFRAGDAAGYQLAEVVLARIHALGESTMTTQEVEELQDRNRRIGTS